ncbi:HD domain-containing protein [Ferroplasma sp.]|uniref:HD domain-containing protein n=1 Tax=Ferroplasma sp. TaxID=2591003 RepID=UPI00262A86D1|nr:HD domain-containing protein [Ferroplasma sp.]
MYKIIQDPVNGPIKIEGIFNEIVDSKYFQRLRYIKQLGLCNTVFPGANHTRFEHSLGSMFLAKELMEALGIDSNIPALAALLHDIGHMPFSHGIEEEFHSLYGVVHEDITKKIIKGSSPYNDSNIPDILKQHGYNPQDIADVATGTSKKYPLFSEIVSGPMDVDEIDYLRRDALFCGVTMGQIDYKRLFNTVVVDDNELIGVEKSIPTIESVIITRILMFNTVYFHKTCRIAQKMLGYAYMDMKDRSIEDIKLNDFEFMEKIKKGDSSDMLKHILNRELFKVAFRAGYSKEKLQSVKESLEEFNSHEYIIDIIPPLYFSGRGRIKNYATVYFSSKKQGITDVSSIAMALSGEMENRQILVSCAKGIYKKVSGILNEFNL